MMEEQGCVAKELENQLSHPHWIDCLNVERGGNIMKSSRLFLAALLMSTILLEHGQSFAATVSDATQTASGGGVTAKVTYLNPKSGDDLRFRVVLDTHSVDLDAYDLKAIIVLRDNAGKSYLPTAVENKGSGHHREATVIFPKVSTDAKRLDVVIKDVAGVKERTFQWNIE